MGSHMRTELFLEAIRQVQSTRSRSRFTGTIFHLNRASQYTSTDFRALIKTMGMKQSMGSIGDSYDNALAKNLWSL